LRRERIGELASYERKPLRFTGLLSSDIDQDLTPEGTSVPHRRVLRRRCPSTSGLVFPGHLPRSPARTIDSSFCYDLFSGPSPLDCASSIRSLYQGGLHWLQPIFPRAHRSVEVPSQRGRERRNWVVERPRGQCIPNDLHSGQPLVGIVGVEDPYADYDRGQAAETNCKAVPAATTQAAKAVSSTIQPVISPKISPAATVVSASCTRYAASLRISSRSPCKS
jgi:hypothetical protein